MSSGHLIPSGTIGTVKNKARCFLFCVLAFLALAGPAQEAAPLSVGSTTPDIELNNIINYQSSSVRLSDFKGKLLILDFWATWCTSCLHGFSKLDSLQRQFGDQLQVLLVNSQSTGDNEQKVTALFQKHMIRDGRKFNLPSVVGDTVLSKLFPHRFLPHYVWIKNGKVAAITASEEVTAENIRTMLEDRPVTLKRKNDNMEYDRRKPLFLDGNGGNGESIRYSSLISGRLEGLPSGTFRQVDNNSLVSRVTITNQPLLQLYRLAFGVYLPDNRILLEAGDSSQLVGSNDQCTAKEDRLWCYELITPPVTREVADRKMQHSLREFFGYTAAIEKRLLPCWVLRNSNPRRNPLSKGGQPEHNLGEQGSKYLRHLPVSRLVSRLNHIWPSPVVDETSQAHPLNLQLPADLKNIDEVKSALLKYGFELVREERPFEVLVLSDKKPNN